MAYKHKALDNRRKAKRNLERLLRKLDELDIDFARLEMAPNTGQARSMSPHWRIENVVGVHIYCEDGRRWYADVEFKVPDGVPKVLGVPVKMPCSTSEEAERFALSILGQIKAKPAKPSLDGDFRSFILDDFEFEIPAEMFAEMMAAQRAVFGDGGDDGFDYVAGRLEEVRESFGGRVTEESLRNISDDRRMELAAVCSMALTVGLNRWPPSRFDEKTDNLEGPFGRNVERSESEGPVATMRIMPRESGLKH